MDINSFFEKKIGDGRDTLFWKDIWIGDICLKDRFPRLFRLENNQEAYVKERIHDSNGSRLFTWNWTREVTGRVLGELNQLKTLIISNITLSEGPSDWKWILDNSAIYNSKLVSTKIDALTIQRLGQSQETMRNNFIPRKINIFVWRIVRGRLPVRA
ncbi:uncharacterized protein [Rutidosis leptorrhynchoides]|uniref:uncharacterized protein n=1 Tax=Rutidosis leptorrhynchoides TaxID=125765 RepID=UPI003A998E36